MRRAASEPARRLNKLSEDLRRKHGSDLGKLIESLGLSGREVWRGAALGITTASLTRHRFPAILASA